MYSEKVIKHFKNPTFVGEIDNPDGIGEVGNKVCGDVMVVQIKVGKKQNNSTPIEFIKDIRFQTFGCVAAIASSDMLCELAKGKSLEQANQITNKDVSESLGKLPPIKEHCSNLAADALKNAIKDFRSKN
ncbi:iron-sulfur cluster assembly scaffold protein [Candidatus Woesearchaeota archaeon]|jgi:nitrogen fixation protein NifU and related proteins|nr:iron-sulfur cluster assembly scaffold protein [Candidatus Woesearchaeota archaeon]MBT7367883.1 iron-sulfur cluster assembly scaffold protein [Candidatus Woesearchaeota archaeon]